MEETVLLVGGLRTIACLTWRNVSRQKQITQEKLQKRCKKGVNHELEYGSARRFHYGKVIIYIAVLPSLGYVRHEMEDNMGREAPGAQLPTYLIMNENEMVTSTYAN